MGARRLGVPIERQGDATRAAMEQLGMEPFGFLEFLLFVRRDEL